MVKSMHFKSESFAVGTIAAGLLSDCPLVCHPSRGEMRSLAEQESERERRGGKSGLQSGRRAKGRGEGGRETLMIIKTVLTSPPFKFPPDRPL